MNRGGKRRFLGKLVKTGRGGEGGGTEAWMASRNIRRQRQRGEFWGDILSWVMKETEAELGCGSTNEGGKGAMDAKGT